MRVRAAVCVVALLLVAVVGNGDAAGAPRSGHSTALAAGGDLDSAFGLDGMVTTAFPGGSYATAVAIQADGKIVAVGAAAGPSVTGDFTVARYEPDGSLDATFSDAGMVTTAIGGGRDEAQSVAIQENGRIVVAGTDSWRRFAVVRYRPDGELDSSFGDGGIVRTNFAPGQDMAWDVAIQSDGKIVAVGAAGYGQEGFRLARYRRDGSLDPAFGDGGKVMTRYGGGVARAVAIQPDGRIVVAGYNTSLALARYLPDGRLDRTFAGDGRVDPGRIGEPWPLAVALQPDGRIVVAGGYDIFRVGLVRFSLHGQRDRTFGGDGVVVTNMGPGEQALGGLVVQPDGKIVAVGYVGPHEFTDAVVSHFVLLRCRRDGSLDPTFGGDGKVKTFFGDGGSGAAGVALQPDGRIVVVGQSDAPQAFALARYLA